MKYISLFSVAAVTSVVLVACAAPGRIAVYPAGTSAATPMASNESVTVIKGDTLYGIARRHGVALKELAEWNCTEPSHVIRPGQRLWLNGDHRDDCRKLPPVPEPSRTTPATPSPPITPAAAKPAGVIAWQWPAEGKVSVVRKSGVVTGVDIFGTSQAAVRAARDGVVLYSGAGSPGLEEMIVLKHDGNWVSSYAHNRQRLVSEGQWVRAGTIIAHMGDTGTDRTKLHFELRHNGEPVDPLLHLPPR